jgi:surfactin synthase thioesterase subunit
LTVSVPASAGTAATRSPLRRFHPVDRPRARLLCFPHAGGSATAFHKLSGLLRPDVAVIAVQYPGRQDRLDDPAQPDITARAEEALTALAAEPAGPPLALFGHSMGATVAFEVARRLPEAPVALFVSAGRAPDDDSAERGGDDDASILAELGRLGGTDAEVIADEALLPFILPALRSDYRAVRDYRFRPGPPLSCPVIALAGAADPVVAPADALRWAPHTTAAFHTHVLPGGHFYLDPRAADVAAVIRARLTV